MNHAAFFKSLPLSVSPLKMSNQSGHIIPGDVPAVAFAQVPSTGSWGTDRNLFHLCGGRAELCPGHQPFPVPHSVLMLILGSVYLPHSVRISDFWLRKAQFVGGIPAGLGLAL